ncbi:restriction endonuclease subunit S [Enterococcus hirae]|uniref:restriction endonuclease subunit S n=1 Tax=Enterococcus hirae TaxID=1354 RepID=UPI00391BB2BC
MSNDTQPEIRFPGFTEDWEQHKLIEVARYRNGKAHEQAIDESGKYIVVNSKFVSTNGRVKKYTNIIIDPLKKNELAFVLSDVPNGKAIARTFLVDKEHRYSLNQRIAGITPHKDTDSYFLNVLMNRNPYFLKFDNGVGQTNLTKADVENFIGHYPSYEEQQKIGTFFKQLDDTIALHQRKLDLLKETKKGFLQKMFPKNGAKVPEIRFPGFTEDWEQRKLGDLGSVAMNKRIFKDQTSDNGEVPFFKIGTFGSHPDAFISRELFEEYKSKYPYPEVGDILISASGSIGRTVVYQGEDEYFQDSNIVWLKHNGRLDNKFLQQFYSIVKWQGLEGSTIKRLYNKNILDTNISVPTLDEQNKLGAFFEQLDDTIALQQRKLDLLKETKKGFLQKMFV